MQLLSRRRQTRIWIAGMLCLVFLLGTVLGWANTHLLSEDRRFETFTDQLFQKEVSGNMLNLHYSLAYPEKKGITRPKASLGTISLPSSEISSDPVSGASSESSSGTENFAYQTLTKLKTFKISALSEENQLTLDMLLLYYKTQENFQELAVLEEPLSPSLGIQAQLPVLLAEYAFYQKQDIADYLNLLVSVEPYFESILAFEEAKSKQGYFMSDATLDRVLAQCQAFIKDPENNYMLEIFTEKLKEFGKLSRKEQKILIQKHRKILLNKVIPAYQKLILGLQALRGTGRPSQGLAHFNNGKEYYKCLLQSQTGSYVPVKTIQRRLAGQIIQDMETVQKALKRQPSLLRELNGSTDISRMEPREILSSLHNKMKQDFPLLDDTEFTVRYVHKSMQKYLSPAFYLTPPLDTGSPNIIYINPADQRSNLELFTTLSHEGFPGHLYQTVFFGNTKPSDIRYLITSGGYVEGWAVYTESYGYQYASDSPENSSVSYCIRLAWLNRSINLCIYALLDIGIHYYGWDQNEASRLLKLFGITDENALSEIYQYIVETPGNYQKYCWGYLNFLDLKNEWQTALGDDFDLKIFHQNLLEIGPVQFPVLRKYMQKRLNALISEKPRQTACIFHNTEGDACTHLLLFIHSYNYRKISAVSAMPS